MDLAVKKTMQTFYGSPLGWTTDEVYAEYITVCKNEGVEPRSKSVIVREICKEYDCKIEEQVIKTFRRAGFND